MLAGVASTVWESSVYFADGKIPGALGSAHRVSAPYQVLRTQDGYLNIGAGHPAHLGATVPGGPTAMWEPGLSRGQQIGSVQGSADRLTLADSKPTDSIQGR